MENLVRELEFTFKKTEGVLLADKAILSSDDSYRAFKEIIGDDIEITETFAVIFLNNAGKIIGWKKIANGGITSCVVDVRILFSSALKCLATQIIVSHNHPGGTRMPSEEDKRITAKIKEGAKLLDIRLLDHIILTPYNGYYSFADEGML